MFNQWRMDGVSIQNYVIKKGETPRCSARHNRRTERALCPTTRGRDVSKRIMMELTIVSNEIQCIVTRNSKLPGPSRSASQWINWHRKATPTAFPYDEYERCQKNWYISMNKSGRNAPMKLRSDFRTALTLTNRLHRESGEERPEPIPFQQYQKVASVFFFQFFMVELG